MIAADAFWTLLENSQIEFPDYTKAAKEKGNTPTDIGYMIYWVELFTEGSLVMFNVFDGCYINLLLINWGQITNSSARAGQFAVDLTLELMNNCLGSGAYYDMTLSLSDGSDYKVIGQKCAILFTELYDWQIPTFKVNAYG